jgi:hypothetical protein
VHYESPASEASGCFGGRSLEQGFLQLAEVPSAAHCRVPPPPIRRSLTVSRDCPAKPDGPGNKGRPSLQAVQLWWWGWREVKEGLRESRSIALLFPRESCSWANRLMGLYVRNQEKIRSKFTFVCVGRCWLSILECRLPLHRSYGSFAGAAAARIPTEPTSLQRRQPQGQWG